MRRCIPVLALGFFLLSGCKAKKPSSNLSFTVDTAELKAMDSMTAAERRNDSALLKSATQTPGYNAGLDSITFPTPAGWRRYDTALGSIRVLMLDTASSSPRFRINVNIVSDSLRGASIDAYTKGT
ncbi:MAG TPA: hypothetical protein VKU83_09890, partial [Puia sp.]|nr:hypothetical protein [Puia sp.]